MIDRYGSWGGYDQFIQNQEALAEWYCDNNLDKTMDRAIAEYRLFEELDPENNPIDSRAYGYLYKLKKDLVINAIVSDEDFLREIYRLKLRSDEEAKHGV